MSKKKAGVSGGTDKDSDLEFEVKTLHPRYRIEYTLDRFL
jgi:hypothetical protein